MYREAADAIRTKLLNENEQTNKGTMILGTVNQSNTLSNIQTYVTRPLTGNDINFFISNKIK